MANHVEIAEATGLDIYFCDPHSPWQRGSNENTNGLLRQYLPKGTDLSFYGPGMLDNIAAELNARPRKRHDWRTPAEVLDKLLSEATTNHGVDLGRVAGQLTWRPWSSQYGARSLNFCSLPVAVRASSSRISIEVGAL